MTGHAPTVYVVDDDDAFRDSVEVLCGSVGLACAAYSDASCFLTAYSPELRGCLVLDIRMPEMSGLELQRELLARDCRLPILFITGHGDIEIAVAAMKAGAQDFLTKPFRPQELLDRIHQALRTDKEREQEAELYRRAAGRLERLTPRERQVFELIVQGCANKVVANRLDISQRTVELHRSQVMQKMEARSLADLVRLSVQLDRNHAEDASGNEPQ